MYPHSNSTSLLLLLLLLLLLRVQVDPSKIIWTPYDASHEYATFKS